MMLMKKWKYLQRFLLCQLVICVLSTFVIFLYITAKKYPGRKGRIFNMEKLINSIENQGACKVPNPPIDNPDIMRFYGPAPKLKCDQVQEDWVECKASLCFIREKISKAHGNITCTFKDIIRLTDHRYKYGSPLTTSSHYMLHGSDFVEVKCTAKSRRTWSGVLAGINKDTSLGSRQRPLKLKAFLNVLMFGFDSLSRNAFIRKLPMSYKYLTESLNAHVLKGYNIVGDGTPQALIPILTGHTELELPETRKTARFSKYVDVYPFIWKEYKEQGYVTAYNEDEPAFGTFSYRLNGFKKQPTDHYMRTFYLRLANFSTTPLHCVGSKPKHKAMLDYVKDFMLSYNNMPKFAFSFNAELSHNSINMVENADEDVLNWLKDLKKANIFTDTILIMMSDHGSRFQAIRNTLQGKQEERLPFFSFVFPDGFNSRFPVQYANFLDNIDKLTTPFDIYETLADILMMQDQSLYHLAQYKEQKPPRRGISLFEYIPMGRSCFDAYIEPHWCSCLQWKELPLHANSSQLLGQLALTVRAKINGLTEPYRRLCEALEDGLVEWVMKLVPNEKLLKFLRSSDADGFEANMTAETRQSFDLYQVQVLFGKFNMLYEGTIQHWLDDGRFVLNVEDISRINKYEGQSNCVYNVDPDLRKFCYCK